MLILHVLAGLANPLGVNQLLRYIESGGENTDIRPWFWVVWLFLCTLLDGLSLQWHNYIAVCICISIHFSVAHYRTRLTRITP